MKKCSKCSVVKETTQFSKCSSAKDSLQPNCKICNKKDNLKFRTQINPSHHAEWQRNNTDALYTILRRHRKADKSPLIYSIKNPDNEVYIGMTEAFLSVRKGEHKLHYRRAKQGKIPGLPLLHASFDKWGVNNHTFEIVVELEGYSRKQLGFVETSFIQSFKEIGKSLNVRIQ